jgi:hypothetical protein
MMKIYISRNIIGDASLSSARKTTNYEWSIGSHISKDDTIF